MKKRFIFAFILVAILMINFINAEVCCEKNLDGALCTTESSAEKCDLSGNLQAVSTTCDNTVYCDIGCCINTIEGSCTAGSPKEKCQQDGGNWVDSPLCDLPSCQQGCCEVEGGLTYFKNPTECNQIASVSGKETIFHADITDYFECASLSTSGIKGACVLRNTATDVSRPECEIRNKKDCIGPGEEFHAGLLCTANSLQTKCVATTNTACSDDPKDDRVYFQDSCGNNANIYDANKYGDTNYWENIIDPELACSVEEEGAGSCGNCGFPTNVCKPDKRGDSINPVYGDYFCSPINCEYKNHKYSNGESFCAVDSIEDGVILTRDFLNFTDKSPEEIMNYLVNANVPGTEYLVLECDEGDIVASRCDSLRGEYCKEWEITDGFTHAMCEPNRWETCIYQTNKEDCEKEDNGGCAWVTQDFFSILGLRKVPKEVAKGNKILIERNYPMNILDEASGTCVPKVSPGYNFWGGKLTPAEVDVEKVLDNQEMCSLANNVCTVEFDSSRTPSENSACEPIKKQDKFDTWLKERLQFCGMMGDCGVKKNFIGELGLNSISPKKDFNLGNILSWTNITENLKTAQEESEAGNEEENTGGESEQ